VPPLALSATVTPPWRTRPVHFSTILRLIAPLIVLTPVGSSAETGHVTVSADPQASAKTEQVGPIKLHDVPIDQILELLERWTGKSILRPQTLPNTTVSLSLKQEVTKDQAIRAIETLLSLNGVGVSALDENFLKVTPLNATKGEAPELIAGSTLNLPPSGRTASKLFRPKFLRVGEFMPQISGLLNSATGGAPAVFEKANAVLVTDSLTNLQRIETLLAQIDRPEMSRLQPRFYTLTYAKATDVVNKLHGMFTGLLAGDLGSASYSSDERTNQLILFADPQQYAVFDQLIARLDVKSGEDTRTDIINLKHADSKEVATVLTQMVAGQNASNHKSGSDLNPTGTAVTAAAPGSPAAGSSPTPGEQPGRAAQFSNLVSILPEERGNSLIVSGTDNDLRLLAELVDKIDVLLAQVRIEAVIAEVTLDDQHVSGISALGLQVTGNKLVGFSGSASGVSIANGTANGPGDLSGQISIATTPRKSITHVLSVPSIVTTHNHAGKIMVGQSQPIITGTQAMPVAAAGASTSFATNSQVTYKDIGITLTVKPLIGLDGSVQMDITQEVDDILGETTIDGNQQPTIGKRATESFVNAHSGDIIVLGGLQRSSLSRSTSRLGPLPIIGDLLGSRSKDAGRTDLVFFLRPTILSADEPKNVAALRQVEQFPKKDQPEIKRALQVPDSPHKN